MRIDRGAAIGASSSRTRFFETTLERHHTGHFLAGMGKGYFTLDADHRAANVARLRDIIAGTVMRAPAP
jgi:hypothetical protein